jgi:regulatory protein YycH of two-component signal transduction system YycFG
LLVSFKNVIHLTDARNMEHGTHSTAFAGTGLEYTRQRTLPVSAYQVLNNKLSKKPTIISFNKKDLLRLLMDINNYKVSGSTYNAMPSAITENLQFNCFQ